MTAASRHGKPKRGAAHTIGFVGLGDMGMPIARRLVAAGWCVIAFDRDQARMRQAARVGIVEAVSCVDVASAAREFVISMVRDIAQTNEVFFGPAGFHRANATRTYVVMSSIGRHAIRVLATRLRDAHQLLDAPVSGGVAAARDGTLEILVAGQPDVIRRASEWLEQVGSRTTVVSGGIGAAQAAKTVSQLVQVLQVFATVEGIALAQAYGLSERDALQVLETTLGRTWAIDRWEDVKAAFARGGRNVSLDLLRKDLEIALDDAQIEHVQLPFTAAGLQRLVETLAVDTQQPDRTPPSLPPHRA